jgi:hypothetical protein
MGSGEGEIELAGAVMEADGAYRQEEERRFGCL